ncbi:hypothetical protein HAZT_HAZT004487 [Hyalella azteca]|uniref:DDE-1 domain-containing protein n=1 Tax=Hyalella azteca TaxID=294128 RepID=A0A6A0GQ20_HYAAZ|nr:hypothetical protein HAZT_HAZT004487 [Hyalella azteca]
MPRSYKRPKGARTYQNYKGDLVDQVVQKIKDKELSLTKAVKQYGIGKGALFNRVHGKTVLSPGRQTILSQVEEALIVKRTLQCSDYGFPLQPMDLRIIVKSYLDSEGCTVPMFSMNLPGPDWALSFIKRHTSGWMDANAFQKWFSELLLPHLQNLDGPKAVIGDNLSAHFSETVLKLAEDNDIKFVCLPPNSTDKTQPLDVAFFGPMKKAWKHVLEEFKVENPSLSIVNKQVFPKQVNKLFKHPSFYPNIEKNLKSGFRATGIFPLDINNLLRRLGNIRTGTRKDATPVLSRAISSTTSSSLAIEESPEASSLSNTFVNYLEEKKFPKCAREARRGGRGAKNQAGTRVVSTISQDEDEISGQSTLDMHPSTSKDPFAYAVQMNVKRKLDLLAKRDNAESESTDMDTDPDSEEIYDVRPTRSRNARVLTPMLSPAGTRYTSRHTIKGAERNILS